MPFAGARCPWTAVGLAVALLVGAGCRSLPDPIARRPGRVHVVGHHDGYMTVLIRTLDGSRVLWMDRNASQLAKEAWLEPGSHQLGIACVLHEPWGTRIIQGSGGVAVEADAVYRLRGLLSDDEQTCTPAAYPQRRAPSR
ncbi:MAG: hypothetical protein U0900_18585 [Myxococcota bacterium]